MFRQITKLRNGWRFACDEAWLSDAVILETRAEVDAHAQHVLIAEAVIERDIHA